MWKAASWFTKETLSLELLTFRKYQRYVRTKENYVWDWNSQKQTENIFLAKSEFQPVIYSSQSGACHSKQGAKLKTILNSLYCVKDLRISFHSKIRRVTTSKRHRYERTHRFVIHVLLLICHFKFKPQMVDGNPMTSRKVLHRTWKNSKTV